MHAVGLTDTVKASFIIFNVYLYLDDARGVASIWTLTRV